MEDTKWRVRRDLINKLVKMGYPKEFGEAIASGLGSEKTMSRMLGYLCSANPRSAEEIADEMLAINSDRDRWVQKKTVEFYNSKYNEFLYYGLETGEDE